MAATALAVVAAVVLISYGLLRFFPDETRAVLRFINTSRAVVFGLLWTATALSFIVSGVALLMLVGAVMLALVVLQILVDDLHEQALDVIT